MPDTLLNSGKVEAASVGAGASYTFDKVPCHGQSTLVVQVDMTGTSGQLTVSVTPYEADHTTLPPVTTLTPIQTDMQTSGGHNYFFGQFDVYAFEEVQIKITNNSGSTQTLTRASWRLNA